MYRQFNYKKFTRFSIYYYGFDTAIRADLARAIYILSTQGDENGVKGIPDMPFFIDGCNRNHLHFVFTKDNIKKFVFSEKIVKVSAKFTSLFLLEIDKSCFINPALADVIIPTTKYKVNAPFLNSLRNHEFIAKKNNLQGYPSG